MIWSFIRVNNGSDLRKLCIHISEVITTVYSYNDHERLEIEKNCTTYEEDKNIFL